VPIARRPPPDQVVAFCQQAGLSMHGHPMVWNFRKWSVPDWLPRDPVLAEPFWQQRIEELAARYGQVMDRWDVVNEAAAGYVYPRVWPMPEDYVCKSFQWAQAALPPHARLDINEVTACWFGAEQPYMDLIEQLLARKVKLGGIGLQFHLFEDHELEQLLHGTLIQPQRMLALLDRMARFNLPVHISEITLTAPGNHARGLAAQAQVARDLYRLWFSHPAVAGITWWNLPDGGAAPGEDRVFSGLLNEHLEPKPAYEALHGLIQNDWRTEIRASTDADGCLTFRGFHGTYTLRTGCGMQLALRLEPGRDTQMRIRL